MEIKKSPKADLENKKAMFLEVGFVLALAILLFAFEWKTSASETDTYAMPPEIQMEEEIIPITQQMMKPPPPPPPAPRLTDLIDIVEDQELVDEQLELEDAEDQSENKTVVNTDNFGDYDNVSSDEQTIFQIVETMPTFSGGDIMKWLGRNVRYPQAAQDHNIQGRVSVKFVIEKDGSITDAVVTKSVDPLLDKEALRVINSMPKWNPGKQRGKPVRVSFTLPISFRMITQ